MSRMSFELESVCRWTWRA